jgi:hypothetical protein
VIVAEPFLFGVGGDPAPSNLVGSGVTVIALGLFACFPLSACAWPGELI